jgi:predicted membrane-bound spermidine synthase
VNVTLEIVRTIVEDDKSLLLRRRGKDLELVLGNVVLLSSAALETELAFGRLAADALAPVTGGAPRARVVVGGLGFGATLRGVLAVAPPDAEIVVVEKLRTVVEIARAEAADLVGGALDDPRVVVRQADVAEVIAEAPAGSLSAILLDVDNGPEWASFRTNARLYAEAALSRAHAALAPDGIYAVWSGYPADAFVRTLRKAGFFPRVVPLHERGVVRARAYVGALR